MNLISKKRKDAGISQRTLANQIGWHQSRIANYEAGIRTPSLNDCRAIVKALNDFGQACLLDDVFPQPKSLGDA
ncbi:helix-turn-helix domain-containing protein [Serratia fonticola]|uniref:helix-turn-helix domain-containing protein n=1 Tax=Serratia fonticola TaxID=47917 RepID=UPI0014155796|nr:helix-turn-helix transcriptional regulator [Serratia fonticola]QIP93116.1 XRE family transcriptional regulator [Serratia fonticola]